MLTCHATRNEIVDEVLRRSALELIEWQAGGDTLAVLGLGAGIVMAACDRIVKAHPGRGVLAMDLPGSLGFDMRVRAIDAVASSYPTLLIMWSSITQASRYADALQDRGFVPVDLRVYVNGLGSESQPWKRIGAHVFYDLWSADAIAESTSWGGS